MRSGVRKAAYILFHAALWCGLLPASRGQVFVQSAGQGDVSFFAQHIAHDAVIRADGSRILKGSRAYNQSFAAQIDYGLTDRISLTVGIPYVLGKFTDPKDLPPDPVPPSDSCRCLQGALQDFGVTARYRLHGSRRLSVIPSVSVVVPSHSYDYRGTSIAGRGLKELAFAVNAWRRLDFLSRNASLSGRYSYSIVEKALDVPLDRSNVTLQGGYELRKNLGLRGIGDFLVRRNLSLFGTLLLQRTHGGKLRTKSEILSDEEQHQRDRLFRDNSLRLGGGAAFSVGKTQIVGTMIYYVTGSNTHSQRIFTVGVRRHFSLRPLD